MPDKSCPNNTSKVKELLLNGKFDKSLLYNSFEKALFGAHTELRNIKSKIKNSLMSGSGSTFFVLEPEISANFDKADYDIYENLTTISTGVEIVND